MRNFITCRWLHATMNIGMLSMDYPPRAAGGTTVHTYQMAKTFSETGHRPYVVAASHPDAPKEEHGKVEVRRVGRPYTLFSALKAGRLRSNLDVVHGHGTCAYGFMHLYKFPTVIKMHSTWAEEYKRYKEMNRPTGLMKWYVRMDRYCATHAQEVIAISEVIKRETMRYGVPEEKITVIHNGIDAKPFLGASPGKEELGLNNGLVIGYIGRLAPHKGVIPLAKAFRELAQDHEDISLLVVGDGPERSRMEDIISPLGNAVFTGYVPHEQVPAYYATSDIIVFPTRYEPLGNVVLESMAAGKPLIASGTGGIPEIFNGKAGIMIEPPTEQDYKELKNGLEKLIGSASLRSSMSKVGRKEVKKYSWEKVCTKTAEVLESALRA